MASIGHIAVGMAGARVYRRGQQTRWTLFTSMVIWSVLSMLPDADVLGFGFGGRYADPLGHRGATHSFAFVVFVSLAVGLIAFGLRQSPVRAMLVAAVVVGSHVSPERVQPAHGPAGQKSSKLLISESRRYGIHGSALR